MGATDQCHGQAEEMLALSRQAGWGREGREVSAQILNGETKGLADRLVLHLRERKVIENDSEVIGLRNQLERNAFC